MSDTRSRNTLPLLKRPGPIGLIGALMFSGMLHAQTVDIYSFSATTGATLDPMSGSAVLIGPNQDDAASAVTNIGFTFNFEGIDYTQFSVNSNGGMRLGGSAITAFNIDNINDANNNPKIAPFVADGSTSTGNVATVLTGSAPDRIRVIQWNTGVDYNAASANVLFQVWLYETTNVIEYRYGAGAPTGSNGFWWTGIAGAAGTNYINVRPGFVGSTTDMTRLQAYPGAGTVFTFSPPAPCTPPPAPGNTIASVTSGCPGVTTSLSLQNNTPGSGVSYQWESSPDGNSWSPIGGATSATYTTGAINTTTWYRNEVTCSTGPSTVTSDPVEITISSPPATYYTYTGTQFTENFASWGNRCSTADVPSLASNHWVNTPAFGAGSWRQSNTTVLASGWNNISGGFTSTTVAANPNSVPITYPSARFHSRQGSSVIGTLDFHVDMSAATGSELLRFEYINSAGSGNLAVLVSTDGGANFTQLGSTLLTTSINTWATQQFTIGSTSATTVIRLRGTAAPSAAGNDIGVDNFRIIPAATCPAPTNAAAAVTAPGSVDITWSCASCTGNFLVEYGPTGFTLGTGTVAGPFATSPGSITGLANGSYQAYVRQDCGAGGISSNVGPLAFHIVPGDFCASAINFAGSNPTDTPVSPSATTANAQNTYSSSTCNANMPGPDVLLYHDVAVGATLSFTVQNIGGATMVLAYGDNCPGDVHLACGASYFTTGPIANVEGQVTWTNNTCETQRVYLQVEGAGAGGPMYIWNYSYVTGGASCTVVDGITATITGPNSADVSWNATCSGDVIVEYGPAGFTPGTGATAGSGTAIPVSGTSTSLSGLTPGQTYDVYVRQDCSGDFSANSTVTTFTLTLGENCATAIDLANESAPLIASTNGAINDVPSLGCGAAGGGDLVYFISVPDGATINFEAIHDYNAIVEVSFGSSCPGTILTCVPGLDQYSWTNTTGGAQNVYWLQDGTASGDFLLNWDLQDPCSIDTDGDGVADCFDDCPNTAGQTGSVCDANPDPNQVTLGELDGSCNCIPVSCTQDITLEFQTDANGDQTSWEITPFDSEVVLCSGGNFPNNAVITNNCCLPEGCFKLRVMDSAGDGITNGGYILRTSTNERIIDNRGNFSTGSESSIVNNGNFCLPIGADRPIYTSCDKLDWLNNQFLVASANAAVSAEWVPNAPNSAQDPTSGYDFWFFDPNGSYSFVRQRRHDQSDGFGNVGATRTAHMQINNWALANHIPQGVLMNVRVRGVVNGDPLEWGPACRFKIDPVAAACPMTKLMDIPGNQFISCGQFRPWANNSYAHARPVSGASAYQFRFRQPAEGYEVVRTVSAYYVQLFWNSSVGAPLVTGSQYEVDVRAFKNGQWCPWGDVCTLNIGTPVNGGGQQQSALIEEAATLNMWPNPNRGDQLFLTITAVPAGVTTITADVFDMYGKRVAAETYAVNEGMFNATMDLNGKLAAGMYMVNISIGDVVKTQRLIVHL